MARFKSWRCISCKHVVMAEFHPEPIKWDDGHVCYFAINEGYFNFDDLVDPPKTDGPIFYHKGEETK